MPDRSVPQSDMDQISGAIIALGGFGIVLGALDALYLGDGEHTMPVIKRVSLKVAGGGLVIAVGFLLKAVGL